VHHSQPYLARLDRQRQAFGLDVEAVGLDAGYVTPMVCQGLAQRQLLGVMGYRRPNAVDARRLTDCGKRVYARRKETVERSFADAKQLHGHRYARMRGWLRERAMPAGSGGAEHQEDRLAEGASSCPFARTGHRQRVRTAIRRTSRP
jgi:hypothetical protein